MGFDTRTIVKSVTPTVDNDITIGVEIGYIWINNSINPNEVYICTDNTQGAAVWELMN